MQGKGVYERFSYKAMIKSNELENEGICYCDNCRKKTPYSTYTVRDMGGWKDGAHYIFVGKQARCNICTKMVFPTEIKDYNERMLNETALRESIIH